MDDTPRGCEGLNVRWPELEMGLSLRQVMEEDLERTERLIQESRAELEAAEAVSREKKQAICEAERYRDRLTAFLESEEPGFWSKFGDSGAETATTSRRTVPTLKSTFEGLQKAKRHSDRMRVYAFGNSGKVIAREAAEVLISLGLSESKSVRYLAKNLTTAMADSDEFVKEPDGTFIHTEFLATGTGRAAEPVAELDLATSRDARNEDPAAPGSGSAFAQAESGGP